MSFFALLLYGMAPARAAGNAEEAEATFQLGARAYAAEDYESALANFLASNRLAPNPSVAFNIARCYAELERYAQAYRWFTVASEGLASPQVQAAVAQELSKIAPRVVVYDIASDPPGADVYLDRRELGAIGTTPFRVAMDPQSSPRRFLFDRAGYESVAVENVRGRRGETVAVRGDLTQVVGTLQIEAEAGTEAHLGAPDGELLCVAPCTAKVPPGTLILHFRREGYRDAVRQLEIRVGEETKTAVELAPKTGSVVVNTLERGALVEIDGVSVGFTPAVIASVPVGDRTLRVSQPGYEPYETSVTVQDDRQIALPEIELRPLDEVTAVSRRAEPIELAPSSVTVISKEELRAFGYPTLYEALRGVRGFAMSFDGIYGQANVRGVGQPGDYNNRLLILQDGAVLNDNAVAQGFLGYDARTDLGGVERIEIVRGPGSVLYGTGAVSGVLNLVMDPLDAREGTRVTVGTFENAVARGSAQMHYRFSKSSGVRASVSGATSDGYPVSVKLRGAGGTVEVPDMNKFQSITTAGRLWLGQVSLQWLHTKRALATPSEVFLTDFEKEDQTAADERTMLELKLDTAVSPSVDVLSRVYFNRFRFEGEIPFVGGSVTESQTAMWVGAEARVAAKFGETARVTIGGLGEVNPQVRLEGALNDGTSGVPVQTYLDSNIPYQLGAGYALVDWAPVQQVRLSGGARIDYNTATTNLTTSPRATVVLVPDDGDFIKLVAGQSFRSPSIFELYYDSPFAVPAPQGTVRPETLQSVEAEYTHAFDANLALTLATYAARAQDFLVQAPAPPELLGSFDDPSALTIVNSGETDRILGADAELRRSFQGGFMFSAFYSYLDARQVVADGPDVILPKLPLHQSSAKVVVPLAGSVARVGVRLTLEAARRLGTAHPSGLDPAIIGDIVLSGSAPERRFEYSVGLYNAFNQGYSQPTALFPYRRLPQQGRSFLAQLSLGF